MIDCLAPLPAATIAQYLAGDLGPEEETAFEEHYFSCAQCTAAVESVSSLTSAIREAIPAALTTSRLEELRRSLRIHETAVAAGQLAEAWFTPDLDLLVHVLRSDLQDVTRMDLEVYGAGDELFMLVEAVPFDAEKGAVLVACQRHLRGEEDVEDTRFRLVSVRGATRSVVGDYVVRHHWNPGV